MRNDNHKLQEALELMNSETQPVFIEDLNESIQRAVEKAKSNKVAVVESVSPFTTSEKKRLEDILNIVLKRKVKVNYLIKPSLLGGFRVTVGDWKLDGTVIYHLEKIKSSFAVK